eukprot:gene32479-39268_t
MVELTEEDYLEICAVCQTKQDNIANLDNQTFAVNTAPGCGHKFCPSCIKREFQSKRQFACPRCKIMVTEGKLSRRSLEETLSERDFAIRRKLRSIFNKTEEEFESDKHFKDYEEMVEDYIYNLVNCVDVESTKQAIESYRQENARMTALNLMRAEEKLKEELVLIKLDQEKRSQQEKAYADQLQEERKRKQDKKKLQNQMLLGEGVSLADGDAESSKDVKQTMNPQAGAVPNPVLMFLNQRALPNAINQVSTSSFKPNTQEDNVKVHLAGGYDYNVIYEARNQAQIKSELL